MDLQLLQKYDIPVPRYTSYPTVPLWKIEETNAGHWIGEVKHSFEKQREISLYIHLPYCENLCTYCGCNKHITKNHLVELPYIKAVLKEWQMYLQHLDSKPIIKELHLGGGTPTFFSPENLSILIEGLLQKAEVPYKADLSFEAHPFSTTYDHLKVLKELGFNRISIGVQDFDEMILRIINRYQTTEQVKIVTEQARALGYESVNFDLIYGLPKQTPEHIINNVKEVAALKPDRIAFYSYAHVPEVKKSQRAYSEKDLPLGADKLQLYRLGKALLEKESYYDIGMDHFALKSDALYLAARKKNMHRNFMGYTPYHCELNIGLGVSAISDCWTAYSQNEKTIKTYLNAIKEDRLPVFKNHFLSTKDQKIRKHILNLMCHFETDWLADKENFSFELQHAFAGLEKDGLLKVFPHQVKVTERGKSFIRNISRVLDQRMSESEGKTTFSQAV